MERPLPFGISHQARLFKLTAEHALDRALRLLHPHTAHELVRNREAARDWLVNYLWSIWRTRQKMTDHLAVHRTSSLDAGEGFEHVTFGPRDRHRHPLRPRTLIERDVDDPAFDILATGMLGGKVRLREVEWQGVDDDIEQLEALGDTHMLVRAVRRRTGKALHRGAGKSLRSSNGPLRIEGGRQAFRVTMETSRGSAKRVVSRAPRRHLGGVLASRRLIQRPLTH